ncbi:MAG: dihydrofolate reductase [Lachnospiraceae bacterium]|nr:dihydrofolate reductase [Lachnospiraceae bacterium]
MNIVVTVDENWAVGRQDKLLVQIPADQRNFQRLTMGGTVVMGRKTLQAMPQGQPLYGRNNIILSENRDFKVRGTQVLHSLEELYDKIKNISDEDIYVCGGESLYRQLLKQCDIAYVTMVEKAYDADRYFENLDRNEEWELLEESDEQTYFDITYYFRKYGRKK